MLGKKSNFHNHKKQNQFSCTTGHIKLLLTDSEEETLIFAQIISALMKNIWAWSNPISLNYPRSHKICWHWHHIKSLIFHWKGLVPLNTVAFFYIILIRCLFQQIIAFKDFNFNLKCFKIMLLIAFKILDHCKMIKSSQYSFIRLHSS